MNGSSGMHVQLNGGSGLKQITRQRVEGIDERLVREEVHLGLSGLDGRLHVVTRGEVEFGLLSRWPIGEGR